MKICKYAKKMQKCKKLKSTQKCKIKNTKVKKYISTHNLAIFWATDSRFCMAVNMVCPTKLQSTKVQKVKKYKNTKTHKMQICKKMQKCKKLKST